MSYPGEPVQLIRFFKRLAGYLGVSAVLPLKDGSLLFRFGKGRQHAELFHCPVKKPGGRKHPALEGCFFAKKLTDREIQPLLLRLRRVRHPAAPDSVYPLAFRENTDRPISLGAEFAARHLFRFLRAGSTSWGPFLFRGAEEREKTSVGLAFEGAGALVTFEVRKADAGPGPEWTKVDPLAVRIVEDTRSPKLKKSFEGAVENYLLYALNRSVGPTQRVEVGPKSAGPASTERGTGPLEDMMALTMAHRDSKLSRIQENMDETPQDSFFLEPFLRQIGTQETLGTFLDADEGLAVVVHTDRECATKLAWINATAHCRYLYSRLTPLPTTMPARRIQWLEPSQLESIMGNESNLRDQVREVLKDRRAKVVTLMGTCVGDVTGLDYEGILAQATPGSSAPVVMVNQMLEHFMEIDDIWPQLFQIVRRDATPRAGVINLVGYTPAGSSFAAELESCLPRLGLRSNGILVPSFRTPAVENFLEAELTVVNTARSARYEFGKVRQSIPEMQYLDLAPPFGRKAAIRFYDELVSLAPGSAPDTSAEQLWLPYQQDWEHWHGRAEHHEAAVVVRPQDLTYILEPDNLHGIDLVGLLREMGFQVRIATIDGKVVEGAARAAAMLTGHLSGRLSADEGIAVEPFGDTDDVSYVLEDIDSSLVFSEYPPDQRVLDAGKMFFHPRDFELGLAGAVRTIARLTRLAESGFHRSFEIKAGEKAARA